MVKGEELVADEQRLLASPGAEEQLRRLLRHHALARYGNVMITPHIAFFSREATERILETTVTNISSLLASNPANVVT